MSKNVGGLLVLGGAALGGYLIYKAFVDDGEEIQYGSAPPPGPALPSNPRDTQPLTAQASPTQNNLKALMMGEPEFQHNPNKNSLNVWQWNYYYSLATGKQSPDIHLGHAFPGMTVPQIEATAITWEQWYDMARTMAVTGGLSGGPVTQFTYPGPRGARPSTQASARGYERAGYRRIY